MVFGRFMFGLGNESMYVCQSAIVSSWFINFELPIAISIITGIPLIGSFLNGALLPDIYEKTQSLGDSFFFGFKMCNLGFILSSIVIVFDYWAANEDDEIFKQFKDNKRNFGSGQKPKKLNETINGEKIYVKSFK